MQAEETAERARAALARVPALAATCVRAGATGVWLFGSLATGQWRRADIDLAVAGLQPMDCDGLWAELSRQAWPHQLDLVHLESAPAALRMVIEGEGRDVTHARSGS